LIFGIAGACRSDELTNVTVDDIETSNSSLIIKIPKTKTKIPRVFVVTNIEGKVDFIGLFRKYADLRPSNVSHRRFFIFYKGGKCTSQPVGKNTFGKTPSIISTYLDLPNPSMYTGHCLRRSSATLLADSGADITTIKRHGGWKSTAVAEGYIQDSVQNKTKIANQVLQTGTSTNSTNQETINLTSKENVLCDLPANIKFKNCASVSFTVNVNK
jgi:integrase